MYAYLFIEIKHTYNLFGSEFFYLRFFVKTWQQSTFIQKLQLLASKNHGNFVLKISQTYFFACKL